MSDSVRIVAVIVCIAVAPILSLYGYLVWRNQDLSAENARLRDACGIRGTAR